MTKRNWLWAGVGVLAVLAIALMWGSYGTHRVSITEAQVQERINAKLDKEFETNGRTGFFVKTVQMKSATVHIQSGQLTALVEIEGTLRGGKKFTLAASTVGVPAYSRGEFFFRPSVVEIQEFSFEGNSPTDTLTRFARRYMSDEKARQAVEDAAPKIEAWMTTIAQNAATHALERRPVYTLKGDVKGTIIRASLESVKIDGDRVVVTFSLLQLTLSILLGLGCLFGAIGLLWALIQCPTLGAVVLTTSLIQ